ncbi:hypothetical protein BaRGS_00012919 [Batillaria attramentaria]|uniref:Uncharacterized protein n=1 Tax=Batillaria attramentaria TaxID=370345 RepID=A0ABD0L8N6_9CAEN
MLKLKQEKKPTTKMQTSVSEKRQEACGPLSGDLEDVVIGESTEGGSEKNSSEVLRTDIKIKEEKVDDGYCEDPPKPSNVTEDGSCLVEVKEELEDGERAAGDEADILLRIQEQCATIQSQAKTRKHAVSDIKSEQLSELDFADTVKKEVVETAQLPVIVETKPVKEEIPDSTPTAAASSIGPQITSVFSSDMASLQETADRMTAAAALTAVGQPTVLQQQQVPQPVSSPMNTTLTPAQTLIQLASSIPAQVHVSRAVAPVITGLFAQTPVQVVSGAGQVQVSTPQSASVNTASTIQNLLEDSNLQAEEAAAFEVLAEWSSMSSAHQQLTGMEGGAPTDDDHTNDSTYSSSSSNPDGGAAGYYRAGFASSGGMRMQRKRFSNKMAEDACGKKRKGSEQPTKSGLQTFLESVTFRLLTNLPSANATHFASSMADVRHLDVMAQVISLDFTRTTEAYLGVHGKTVSLQSVMLAFHDQAVRCPTPGCNGRGHVNNNRSTHRSLSGCPLAAMGKLMSQQQGKKSGVHLVVLPKSDDPSKAVLATCTETDLIKLAAKEMMQGSDRILRPMILTKQLELQDTNPVVSTATPRSNLAKELEKYNRPTADIAPSQPPKQPTLVAASTGPAAVPSVNVPASARMAEKAKPPRSRDNAPERPNILSRRPHFKPRYSYVSASSAAMGMCTATPSPPVTVKSELPAPSSCSISSVNSVAGNMAVKQSPQAAMPVFNQVSAQMSGGRVMSPVDTLPAAMVMQGQGLSPLNIPQPVTKTLTNNSSIMNRASGNNSPVMIPDSSPGVGLYNGSPHSSPPQSPDSRSLLSQSHRGRDLIQCPTPGCDGSGHITGNYTSHRSLSGCPMADRATVQANQVEQKCPTPGCDGSGHVTGNYASHRSLSGCPRAAKMKKLMLRDGDKSDVEEPLRCPIPGCDGSGHITGKYLTHRSASGCPLANKQRLQRQLIVGIENQDPVLARSIKLEGGIGCPTPGCDGSGHINGSFLSHRSLSGCPRATSAMRRARLTPAELLNLQMKAQAGEDLFSEEDLATLDAEIEQLRAANEAMEEEVGGLRMEVTELESSLDSYHTHNQSLDARDSSITEYLQGLQSKLVSCLRTVPFPEAEQPELTEENLIHFVTKIQRLYCNGDASRGSETSSLFSAIKSALAEIEVN